MNLNGNKYTGEKVKGSKDYHVITKFKWDIGLSSISSYLFKITLCNTYYIFTAILCDQAS